MAIKKGLKPDPPEFNSSEAITAFVVWLMNRNYRTIMSTADSASVPLELVSKFCKHYNLPEERPGWENLVTKIKE